MCQDTMHVWRSQNSYRRQFSSVPMWVPELEFRSCGLATSYLLSHLISPQASKSSLNFKPLWQPAFQAVSTAVLFGNWEVNVEGQHYFLPLNSIASKMSRRIQENLAVGSAAQLLRALALQRTWVWCPAPMWQLIPFHHASWRGPSALFRPLGH